jgi:hypothetical protein
MHLNPFCICCQINKQEQHIRSFQDEEKKLTYMQHVLRRFAEADENDCAPSISVELKKYFSEFWQVPIKDYTEIKKEFNSLMMKLEPKLRQVIRSAEDPLKEALLYARIGNYIDFAAMSHVDQDKVLSMMEEENKEPLDEAEYALFCEELSHARTLVYLTDNCGEILLDKLVLELLKEQYPNLAITVIVRGEPVVNDATLEDARMCGLPDIVPVIGNGSGIGGTWLPDINDEAHELLSHADLILSKGQGNFETLHGCGLNIYYLFLCKCEWFMRLFQAEKFQGMFVNERRVQTTP